MHFKDTVTAVKENKWQHVLIATVIVFAVSVAAAFAPYLYKSYAAKEAKQSGVTPSLEHTVKHTRYAVYFYSENEINALRSFMLRYLPLEKSGLDQAAAKNIIRSILIARTVTIDELNNIQELCDQSVGNLYYQAFEQNDFLAIVTETILRPVPEGLMLDQAIEQKIEVIRSLMANFQADATKELEVTLRGLQQCKI